ncbi:MAG: 7-carboxy-7-deazaguanine synthase QueE [Nitrospirae bacterium]|nr:7-carboxy-7-deazaguanine synthase QueE [Nitrospirota bacterium]
MRITEIFYSIQGESSFAGRPCAFVRLTGCPLRCMWCDSEYTFYGGTEMALDDVLAKVRSFDCRLVEVTGGEPLHQPEAFTLIERLCADGYEVLVETSGAIDIAPVDPRAHIIMDVKCPGSGMMDRMDWNNLDRIARKDEVKFVIKDRADYEFARAITERHKLAGRCPVLFSPSFGELDPRQLAEWVLADKLPVRVQLQLHKFIWDPHMKGV